MSEAMVSLEHVTKNYGMVRAVDDLCLSVEPGKVISLLGPSGCGKTTSLRIIAGLERPDGGVIRIMGAVVSDLRQGIYLPAHKRNIGMVFQSYAIWPHMTVAANIGYPLRVRHLSNSVIRKKVSSVLELVNMAGLEDRPASLISGGQQQRVALARALIYEPDLLLMDEPFSNLDAKLREQMRIELKLLQSRLGITVIFVTHDQVEALSLSDWIILMNDGHIEQSGVPQDLYERPTTPFARDFLGKTVILRGRYWWNGIDPSVNIHGFICPVENKSGGKDIKHGDEVYCAIRPEDMIVRPADSPGPLKMGLQGSLETLLFVGDHYEGTMRITTSESILLFLPKTERWKEGQQVTVEFPPEALTVWAREKEASD